ncbi:oligosaccharyl transferase subunit [Purpureocillium lavendulum]|uniref:Oligosaccharyl transferase subunit n=1 Tax=Purpureocillium lavendulum TaxID=1247861 RepID=A0AB34FWD8_9HYPO|nr:oligosaccharyl transferase subunit [Purpureocillium lavendulum]
MPQPPVRPPQLQDIFTAGSSTTPSSLYIPPPEQTHQLGSRGASPATTKLSSPGSLTMRFLSTLASACALVSGAVAAASKAPKSSEQRFSEFRQLARLSSTIQLNDVSYKSLTAAPRDYSVAVLLTALDARFGCQLCREFQPEWDLVGRSWTKGDKKGEARMIFGTLDFSEGRDIFLQVHSWLVRHLPGRPHPDIKRPINYIRWASGITLLLGVGTLIATAGPYLLPIIQNRNLWAAGTMIAILLFTSGHMFNHIRHVPYVAGDGRGGITYFAGGFQSQLGLETQIVAAMCIEPDGLLSFSTIALGSRIPRMTEPKKQLVAAISWISVMFFLNSFLLSVFRIKNSGYPFSLPPFM